MSVLNSFFLLGLIAAVLPIIIHIFTRDRIQKVAFSTFRFFVNASRNVLRRKRLEEAILLAMRVIACAILAMAFARPIFKPETSAIGIVEAETARVIVVDVSGSMGRSGLLEKLKAEAGKAVKELSDSADAVALISFDNRVTIEQLMTRNMTDVSNKIADLSVGAGGTDIAAALRQADSLLDGVKAGTKEIVLISDLQRTGWQKYTGNWRLGPGIRLTVRPVAPAAEKGNLAIVAADYPRDMVADKRMRTLAVRVANFSTKERRDLKVALQMNGKQVDTKTLHLRANSRAAVRFRRLFDKPGDNPGRISITSDDDQPLDNAFYFNVHVIPRIKVLVVNGRPSPSRTQDAAFFIKTALMPSKEGALDVVEVIAGKLAAKDLEGVSVAVLANVKAVSSSALKALSDLLTRGGGVFFIPGDNVSAGSFRNLFGAIAPCRLRRSMAAQSSRGEAVQTMLGKIDYTHPIFEIFLRPHHGDLSTPKFLRFWEVTDSQLARVLARFDDGRPALLERKIGAGVSMMFCSPVDLKWNNLPLRAVFLPMMHQIVTYLAVRSEKMIEYRTGAALTVAKGCSMTGPDGTKLIGDKPLARTSGLYTEADSSGKAVRMIAVNTDPDESDPATVMEKEVIAALTAGEEDLMIRNAGAGSPETPEDSLWWYLIVAMVVLLMGELFLGNRTIRH